MTGPRQESWLDGDDGRLVRPYTVSNGRTSPGKSLNLASMVQSAGGVPPSGLEPDCAHALDLCREPASVAQLAGRLRLPAAVTKVLLSDLLDSGAMTTVTGLPAVPSEPGEFNEVTETTEAEKADGEDGADEAATPPLAAAAHADRDVLERVLDGLQRRL